MNLGFGGNDLRVWCGWYDEEGVVVEIGGMGGFGGGKIGVVFVE